MGDNGLIGTLSPPPRGVIFDYGNTLIPFGQREVDVIGAALVRFFLESIPGADPSAAKAALGSVWADLAREREETRQETDPRDVIRRTFSALGARADEAGHVEPGIATTLAAFIEAVDLAEGTEEVLTELRARGLKVALLSNYSLGEAIHASLEATGIRTLFDEVVISAELGVVKPHPDLFIRTARRLELSPEEILFVGDNMAADIAGAAAVGMRTAHITEHLAGAYFFDHPGENDADVTPDLVLAHLTDLTHGG